MGSLGNLYINPNKSLAFMFIKGQNYAVVIEVDGVMVTVGLPVPYR
jgi:hypothetical protein